MKRTMPADLLRPIAERPTQAVMTNLLQLADILDWVLAQTGPADITVTSFSISEEFIRRLYHIAKGRRTGRIRLLLDRKATQKTMRLWFFIREVFDAVWLADNHSKVILVTPHAKDRQPVCIVTSQNLTRGNRTEASAISSDPAFFTSVSESVEDLIHFHSVPLDEILRQRIADD